MEEGAEQVTSEDLGVPAVENGGKKEKYVCSGGSSDTIRSGFLTDVKHF